MEIDITDFINNADPFEYSASAAERGQDAGRVTWKAACNDSEKYFFMDTDETRNEFRKYVKGFGAWSEEEIHDWTETQLNALFIQMVSGDMREAGMDDVPMDEFNWQEYEEKASAGYISGRIGHGDDGRIYYYVGE